MAEFEKLINIDLKLQNNKEEIAITKDFKSYLFESLYTIQEYYGIYKFIDIIFVIIEFIQLMAFPMDTVFNKTWGDNWVKTIGNFFRFFQLIYLWKATTFFIITYILICIYIIVLISFFLHITVKSISAKPKSNIVIKGIVLMLQLLAIIQIPFLRTLFSVFSCDNDALEISKEIECKSVIHIVLIIISILFIIIFKSFIILIHSTIYEFGHNINILKSGYTSSTNIILDITKLLLIIIYQFISNEIVLSIITLILSIIILIHFLIIQPYSNEFTMKLYSVLYIYFCWSCIICLISIFLRNSRFKSGIILLMLGYPLLLILLYLNKDEFSVEKLLSFIFVDKNNEYNTLLNIEYFLKLEDSLAEKLKSKEYKLLFAYIINHESKCSDKNCYIKMFMKIPFKVNNFDSLKVLLLQHAELLYKEGISKQPFNIKLRISYVLFLIKRMNKKIKGKNELLLLNKFEKNLECSFIIYKIHKYLNKLEENTESEKNVNNSQSISYKLISNGIKTLIDNIIINYIKFWNILLDANWNDKKNFGEMNKLGQKIKSLNNELNTNINSLESWNLLDHDTIKMYINYLKEIINNNEEAIIFNKKLSEEDDDKHLYDDVNLYQLNYEEMSKSEDYKYIIIDLSRNDFNKISNISFSVCKEFGYMKEELIGNSSDILFPEIFNNFRKIFFKKKVEEFQQKLMNSNKIINSDIWTGNCFGINKIKFLIPFKAKWTIISTEDEKLYGVGNIYLENKKLIDNREHEIIYILTDLNLKIQNYSSNAPELLNINANVEINKLNISDYISELNEYEKEKEESNMSNNTKKKNTKSLEAKKKRFSKTEFFKKYNYQEKNTISIIRWKKKEIGDTIISNTKSNMNRGSVGTIKTKTLDKFQTISSKYKSEMNIETINNNKKEKEKNKNQGKLFLLKVEEAKLHEFKVGYIFILRPYKQKNDIENNNNSFAEDKKKFNCTQTIIGPFNLNNQNNDIFLQNFELEDEHQFTFDVNDMTYKQFKYIENNKEFSLFEELKKKAINKLTKIKKEYLKEETEEEEESSEYENTEDEDSINSASSKDISNEKNEIIKDDKKNLIDETKENSNNNNNNNETPKNPKKIISSKEILNQITNRNSLKNTNELIKKKEEDFYHINFDKVSLYIYNYTLGFVELQKGQSQKISQVTSIINTEKEKLKKSNSKYIVNPKLMKGKKKLNIKKEEDNELNVHSDISSKLKELYRILSSKKRENVITKIITISFFVFILIIGTGILNILIYYKIKNNIYTFFILIQKSEYLYQNILFEITLIKEMLLLYNPFYTNPMNQNKAYYYQILSSMLSHYYTQNAFILSNLTNHFNILTKKDEDSLTKNSVELFIIDPLKSELDNFYQYKTYNVLLYSAYRELNSALYHISKLKSNEIYYYNDHVYYFLKNGMSNLLISSENQMWTLTEKFQLKIKEGHHILIICCCAVFFVYLICSIVFILFYRKLDRKKNQYLSVLKQIDNDMILLSLSKCEKFYQKLQEGKNNKNGNNNNNKKILFDSSSENNSDFDNDINIIPLKRNDNDKSLKAKNDKNDKNKISHNINIYLIILFLIIFIYQLGIYIYYYLRMTNYQRVVTYEYHISMYAANFLYIFISLREYIFDKKAKFYNQSVDTYLEENLNNYYVIFASKSKKKDIYRVYFPDSYQKFLNYLYNGKICEFINNYNNDNPDNKQLKCDELLYKSSGFGFFTIMASFTEEIRTMKDAIDTYYKKAKEKNFVYNESYYNDYRHYEELYNMYNNNRDDYIKNNPANVYRTESHKILFISYNYVLTSTYSFLISESLNQFEQAFKKYNNINLILNIIFLILIVLGFICIWIPFLLKQNSNLKKIKNMLSIVPYELLTNINNINNLLGVEKIII